MTGTSSLARRWKEGPTALIASSALSILVSLVPGRADAGIEPVVEALVCPTPAEQANAPRDLDVCVDRGDGATYVAGDRITVCVTVNIPTIAMYPPPPPPTIRVESLASDGSSRPLMEGQFASGQRCMVGAIVEPLGAETIRAQALHKDGTAFIEDTVAVVTAPR